MQRPSLEYVRSRVNDVSLNEKYFAVDGAVRLVFEQWPRNDNRDQVLVKVIVLNRLYSTNIYDVAAVRDRIVALPFDDRVARGDLKLVDELATVTIGGKPRNLLSFATKYCHWHTPEHYPIFDSFVERMLCEYDKEHRFASIDRTHLRKYDYFLSVLDQFRNFFGLQVFSPKEIDKFLWLEGRGKVKGDGSQIRDMSDLERPDSLLAALP